MFSRVLTPVVLIGALWSGPGLAAAQQTVCRSGDGTCTEVTTFGASVTDFRQSVSGNYRVVTTTVRFQNKANRPLTIGYVTGSGVVTDDQGVRYSLGGANPLRGIGEVNRNTFDPKFTLQPGETSDARFEFIWATQRGQIYGTRFDIELAIREIDPVTGDQWRLGREHALRWTGFPREAAVTAQPSAPTPATPTAATPTAPTPEVDPCEAQPRCNNAGPFIAEVIRVNKAVAAPYNDVTLDITVRYSNATAEPLILGYRSGSSVGVDDVGNQYAWGRRGTHDQSARGIGLVTGASANTTFVIAPGKSRDATYRIWFRAGRRQMGTVYTHDHTVVQLEVLPSNQVREVREFAVGFRDLTPGNFRGAASVEGLLGRLLNAATRKP